MSEELFGSDNRNQELTEGEYRNLEGRLHTATHTFTNVEDGDTNYVSISVGDKPIKLFSSSNGSGGYFSRLYEDNGDMNVTFDGTIVLPEPVNRQNQSYSFETGFEIQRNPTITDTGTEIIETYSSGTTGKNSANAPAPGVVEGKRSLILATNTDYLIEIEDDTQDGEPAVYNIDLNFWEITYNV